MRGVYASRLAGSAKIDSVPALIRTLPLALLALAWFFATHRLFHTRPLYFLHAQHHIARTAQPLSALSFSILERLILLSGTVGVAAVLQPFYPTSLRGLELYLWLNYVLNVIAHSNVDVAPRWVARTVFARVFIATTFHAMHHEHPRGHYGLFTRTLDRHFGTELPDCVARLTARSEGGTHAGERGRGSA